MGKEEETTQPDAATLTLLHRLPDSNYCKSSGSVELHIVCVLLLCKNLKMKS